jgi:hypothetical protein
MTQQEYRQRHRAHIASFVPGRLRIKLYPESRNAQNMDRIRRSLESQSGIQEVTTNRATGSITVKYNHEQHSPAGILGFLEDLDVVMESLGHLLSAQEEDVEEEMFVEPVGFLAAIEDLNKRINKFTGLPIDLKLALPIAFLGAGIWSIAKKGLMIEKVPGWLFLWFALDMFVKLHPTRRERPQD